MVPDAPPVWNIAIVVLVTLFVWRQRADLTQAMYENFGLADWHWLILIVASAVLAHAFITLTLSTVFLRIGRRIPFIPALMTHAEREMIAAVMPFGGAASYVTLVSRFGMYGVTRNDAMLAVLLYSVLGHLSFIAVAVGNGTADRTSQRDRADPDRSGRRSGNCAFYCLHGYRCCLGESRFPAASSGECRDSSTNFATWHARRAFRPARCWRRLFYR